MANLKIAFSMTKIPLILTRVPLTWDQKACLMEWKELQSRNRDMDSSLVDATLGG